MTPDTDRPSKKRGSDATETPSNRSAKRIKPNSILNYMDSTPQQHTSTAQETSSAEMGQWASKLKGSATEGDPTKGDTFLNTSNNQGNQDAAQMLQLTESIGDIFDAPPNSLLIHACNCEGSWGAGIAAAFKTHYPGAFKVYNDYCKEFRHKLFSKSLLIPPQKLDQEKQDFVGCLFTSRSKGKKVDKPDAIIHATKPAMENLLRSIEAWNKAYSDKEEVREVRMCKINSGKFNVKWEDTKKVLESIDVKNFSVKEIRVISREE